MMDVVLAGVAGLVLAVLLSRPPKRPAVPAPPEQAPVAPEGKGAAKQGRQQRPRSKWD